MTSFEIQRDVLTDFRDAGQLLALGLRDNPMTMAVFPDAAERRVAIQSRIFGTLLRVRREPYLRARSEGETIGVVAASAPNQCTPGWSGQLQMAIPIARIPPRHLRRFITWTSAVFAEEPEEPHWHVGPVAVEAVAFVESSKSSQIIIFFVKFNNIT